MDIKVLKTDKKSKRVTFHIKGLTYDAINTIRRNIIEEVPTMALEDIEIRDNSSALYDEILAHRLGLVPLTTDLKSYTVFDECSCKGEGCIKCSCTFTLKAKGPCTVYASDLKSKDPAVKPVYPKMVIVKLLKDQKVEIIGTAKLGRGKEHNKWSPALAYYRSVPEIKITEHGSKVKKLVDVCPVGVFVWKNNKVQIKKDNIMDCQLCGACVDLDAKAVKLGEVKDEFLFSVEPWGQLSVKEIMETAISVHDAKLNEFNKLIKDI